MYPAIYLSFIPILTESYTSEYLPIYLPLISASPQTLPYSCAMTEVSPHSYLLYYIFTYFVPSLCYSLGMNTLPYSGVAILPCNDWVFAIPSHHCTLFILSGYWALPALLVILLPAQSFPNQLLVMTSVSDLQALLSVPKLETNGSNWIIFSICLKWALQKKVFSHLDGTSPQPAATADAGEQTTWMDNKAKAHHLLAQKLHDSTLTKLLHLTTVALMWTSLTKEFTVESSHVVAAMWASCNSLKCADNSNVHTHLDKLHLSMKS